MQKIHIDYWKDKTGEIKNFGDELNKYLIEKLTDLHVSRVDFKLVFNNFPQAVKVLSYYLMRGNISWNDYFKYLKLNKSKPSILLFIGSILSHCRTSNYIVWGAGIMFKDDLFNNADFRAVRGKYSQKRVEDLGYTKPSVLADPAILLPIVYEPHESNIKFKLGVIPHFRHYKEIKNQIDNPSILVIDLNNPIEQVVDEINQCERTISTSLHGIIVSHSYNIPSIWVKFKDVNHDIGGDDIKFADYFSSINIREYKPAIIESLDHFDLSKFISGWSNYNDIDLLKREMIRKMQIDLLKVSPIKIKNSYIK